MISLTRPYLLFLLSTHLVTSYGVEYNQFDVSIRDNNRGGGIQVNLPKSGTNYFQESETYGAGEVPGYGQNNPGRQYQRPVATNTGYGQRAYGQGAFDQSAFGQNAFSQGAFAQSYPAPSRRTQIIGADGSVVQTNYRGGYPGHQLTQVVSSDGSVFQSSSNGQQPFATTPQGNERTNYPQTQRRTYIVAPLTEAPPTQTVPNVQQNVVRLASEIVASFADKNQWKRYKLPNTNKNCYCPQRQ